VRVTNAATSDEAVRIDGLRLSHTTPRPRGQAPSADATASGLPLVLAPGESDSFQVSGSYQLVQTDEGAKTNLHLRASGRGLESGLPFQLGINVHLRGPGAVESGSDTGGSATPGGGPPPWAGPGRGGPPLWANGR
jgi:hypothetical protein